MFSIFPIFAAVLQTGSFVLDKVALSVKGVNFKSYAGMSFPLIFVINGILFLIFKPPFSQELLLGSLVILLISSSLGIIKNLLFYRALKEDGLGEIEMLDLLHYIPVIIFSSVIFADERNFEIIILALAASIAVIWSHWEHHRFRIRRYTLPYFVWTFFVSPISAALSKILLQTFHPVSLEFIRAGIMAVVLGTLFYKQAEKIPLKAVPYIWLTNSLTAAAWIFFYFSYQKLGIVYTLLLFSLQPLLVYFSSVIFLKEKFILKRAIAFCIVLVSIVVAQIIR